MPDKNWQFELEEYIKQGESDKAEKSKAWQTAIGLQAVDGLNTSDYLLDTAKEHIEGKITIDEAQKRIHSYYEQRSVRTETENETNCFGKNCKVVGRKGVSIFPCRVAFDSSQIVRGRVRSRWTSQAVQHHKERVGTERRYSHLCGLEQY